MILLFNSYARRCRETDIYHHLTDRYILPDWVPQCIVVVSALCPSLWPSPLMSLPPTTLKPVLASWLLDVWSTHERYATHNISYTSCKCSALISLFIDTNFFHYVQSTNFCAQSAILSLGHIFIVGCSLTHWPLGDFKEILENQFSS